MKPLVTFITPPSLFLLDERVFPALGILKVAAMVEQLVYPVEHLDLNGVVNYEEAVLNHIRRVESRIFAITATTPQMVAVTKIKNVIKRVLPERESKTIIGGPHPTLVWAAFKKTGSERARLAMKQLSEGYDTVVAGDGEYAIELALRHTPSIIDADDPKSEWWLNPERLENLPLPARHLVDLDSYHYSIDGFKTTPIIGQLGCPFGCNFCAGRDSAMLRRTRQRPIQQIIDEIKMLYEVYGYCGFMFFDDELNVNPKFIDLLMEIVRLQDSLGTDFRCRGFIKAELFTEEQAKWMYRAGFRKTMCGFESGNDRILKNINKNATKDDNTRVMEWSHKYGLGMKALMSLGHPGESMETIQDTLDWLLEVKPDDFDATIITAYPGSPYYDRARRLYNDIYMFEVNDDRLYMKDIDYTQVEDFYKGSIDGYKSYVWTDYITKEELVEQRNALEYAVRGALQIPFYQAGQAVKFEASTGMLPGQIYRTSR